MDNLHHWEPRDEAVYSKDFGELPMYGADCPKTICEWVNAGFTIYEARIAALEAEVARGKSASLRVVEVGAPCVVESISFDYDYDYFRHEGTVYHAKMLRLREHCEVRSVESPGVYVSIKRGTIVQPVQIGKWEDAPTEEYGMARKEEEGGAP